MRLLGFDYGRSRIGVAVGDSLSGSARGLMTIPTQTKGLDSILDRLVREWSPEGFVLGWPTQADGKATALGPSIQEFASRLEARFAQPVYFADERLSSCSARERVRKHRNDPGLDAHAAAVILEGWLMENKSDA
jgi:putative Holliday junction resolvase